MRLDTFWIVDVTLCDVIAIMVASVFFSAVLQFIRPISAAGAPAASFSVASIPAFASKRAASILCLLHEVA